MIFAIFLVRAKTTLENVITDFTPIVPDGIVTLGWVDGKRTKKGSTNQTNTAWRSSVSTKPRLSDKTVERVALGLLSPAPRVAVG